MDPLADHFEGVGQPDFDPLDNHFMLCGSPQLPADLKAIFADRDLQEGDHGEGEPGDYVIEKAFVEK